MMSDFLSHLRHSSKTEKSCAVAHERLLREKMKKIDQSIERGKTCADELNRASSKKVDEAGAAMATLKELMAMLEKGDERQ